MKKKNKKQFPPEPFYGDECPYCHSRELDYQPYDHDGENVSQDVVCTDCGAYWVNYYDLYFIMADNFERGDV